MNNAIDFSTFPNEMITEVRGRMGGQVYYMRNGRIRARKHVIPANPRTRAQQVGRTRFASAVRRWRALDHRGRETWNRRARHMNMSGYNLFISREMNRKRRLKRCAGRRWYRTGPVLLRQAQQCNRRRQTEDAGSIWSICPDTPYGHLTSGGGRSRFNIHKSSYRKIALSFLY